MSRSRKKTPSRSEQRRRREQRQAADEKSVILDTAAIFTCSVEAAGDFAFQCQRVCEDTQGDIDFNRLAHGFWADHTDGPGKELADALAAFIAERERFAAAVAVLKPRFERLAVKDGVHVHLDPVEKYRELVRQKLFPDHAGDLKPDDPSPA
jgi:hypothetical protein